MLPTDDDDDLAEESGCLSKEYTPFISKDDLELLAELKRASADNTTPRINWPTVHSEAISEYGDEKVFCMAFPWLFPEGVGDFNTPRKYELHVHNWTKNLLYYEDGRFARDKLWCFFALNYQHRRRNQARGHWFVDKFLKDAPPTLEQLKKDL